MEKWEYMDLSERSKKAVKEAQAGSSSDLFFTPVFSAPKVLARYDRLLLSKDNPDLILNSMSVPHSLITSNGKFAGYEPDTLFVECFVLSFELKSGKVVARPVANRIRVPVGVEKPPFNRLLQLSLLHGFGFKTVLPLAQYVATEEFVRRPNRSLNTVKEAALSVIRGESERVWDASTSLFNNHYTFRVLDEITRFAIHDDLGFSPRFKKKQI